MSQNIPPNDPAEQERGNPGIDANGQEAVAGNPYYERTRQQDAPDLDAAAPRLRSAEEQRLNRKALVFLGGILLLLVGIAVVLYKQATSGKPEAPKETLAKDISVPTLPQVADSQDPAAVPVAPAEPIQMAPPLPPARPVALQPLAPPASVEERRGPTLAERRMGAASGGDAGRSVGGDELAAAGMNEYGKAVLASMQNGNGMAPVADAGPKRGPDVEDVSSAKFINHPDALLVRGTYLRCVLETRIITDVQGYTSCLVTEPVYSINGRNLLLPKGSKIYGSYGGSPSNNRVSVIWDRITTPNGIDVAMSSPGIDNLGGAGHPGDYNAHWAARITSALMISLLSDAFKYAAAENGPETTTVTSGGVAVTSPYESATARTMERLANEALSENMHRRATVTINQGVVVNVYVAKDVDFTNVLAQRR